MTTIYQHGTLAQLVARQMSGTITVAEMLEHGDTGIGTFEGLNGEAIFLNGEAYHCLLYTSDAADDLTTV